MKKDSILVVDDDPNSLFITSQLLQEEGYHVIPADNGIAALKKLKKDMINLVVTDEKMSGMTGTEMLMEIRKVYPKIPVIVITGYASVGMAVNALKQGAYHFFEKPLTDKLDKFLQTVKQASDLTTIEKIPTEDYDYRDIIGKNKKFKEIFKVVNKVAPTNKTILIEGETGTGKELIAKAIHKKSPRKHNLLVSVSCSGLTDSLLTSELFGHIRGAFTGAMYDRKGRFEVANKGTLFLDEIGDAPLNLQQKLLRVLQEKEFEKVGDSRSIRVDIRVIAASNKDLFYEVKRGRFREDLYYRLNIVNIQIPPLRERKDDIPLLAKHFLNEYQDVKNVLNISDDAMEYLKNYNWPGNIRELQNVIQKAIVLCENDTITASDLPLNILMKDEKRELIYQDKISLPEVLSKTEKEMIKAMLEKTNWNIKETAESLGITRKILTNRIKKYRLKE